MRKKCLVNPFNWSLCFHHLLSVQIQYFWDKNNVKKVEVHSEQEVNQTQETLPVFWCCCNVFLVSVKGGDTVWNKCNCQWWQKSPTPKKQGKRTWVEEKCLVAKSILEWLLINTAVRNLFSFPGETTRNTSSLCAYQLQKTLFQ